MDTWNAKKFHVIAARTILLGVIALFFTAVSLVSLGALAEDNNTTATLCAHFFAKSLIAVFAFFAAKLPLLTLVKLATINGWFSALFWRETVNPESIKSLFTFSTETAYLNNNQTIFTALKPFTKIRKLSIENQIKFYINPFSLLITAIKIFENFCILAIDHLPPRAAPITPSFSIYRALKGIIILVCELLNILLALIEPLANLPYYFCHLLAITIPDAIMWLFFEFKTEKNLSATSIPQPASTLTIGTTRYINQQLLNSKNTVSN